MSLVEQLGPHLPYLRRYARALTGTQKSGDQYVKASLQALAAGEAELAAFHEGGSIVIEVKDDGAGLNRPRILQKARERRLIAEKERSEVLYPPVADDDKDAVLWVASYHRDEWNNDVLTFRSDKSAFIRSAVSL